MKQTVFVGSSLVVAGVSAARGRPAGATPGMLCALALSSRTLWCPAPCCLLRWMDAWARFSREAKQRTQWRNCALLKRRGSLSSTSPTAQQTPWRKYFPSGPRGHRVYTANLTWFSNNPCGVSLLIPFYR